MSLFYLKSKENIMIKLYPAKDQHNSLSYFQKPAESRLQPIKSSLFIRNIFRTMHTAKFVKVLFAFAILQCCFLNSSLFAQVPSCAGGTPYNYIDMSNDPDGVWVSGWLGRAGNCCGGATTNCVEFEVTISEYAVGINFEVFDGALPPGALFYQIDCGPVTNIGVPICLTGPGTYTITFCKPGGNLNRYRITSIPGPYSIPGIGVVTPFVPIR